MIQLKAHKKHKLSCFNSYKRLRKEIREGSVEDSVLASIVYFAYDAYIHSCNQTPHQKDVPRAERMFLLNDEKEAIKKVKGNPA
ncbi:uncharacterized protein FRV6_16301 [Fusarium oxysporum]|uniref:Uncharacterized protein n=1 Tax=Fusarium oxysporum TaxID=5507 RepID=A0A2H3TU66_FUSOX|nr:uncharacterized protein FRV6_16301 [Fusarium oxysporum]